VGKLTKIEEQNFLRQTTPPKMNFSQKALYKIFPKISPWSQNGSTRSKSLRYFPLKKKNLAASYLDGVQQVRFDAVSYYRHMHTNFKLTQ
jgi:hypothetical protein